MSIVGQNVTANYEELLNRDDWEGIRDRFYPMWTDISDYTKEKYGNELSAFLDELIDEALTAFFE